MQNNYRTGLFGGKFARALDFSKTSATSETSKAPREKGQAMRKHGKAIKSDTTEFM
jgi:hypothetical protein